MYLLSKDEVYDYDLNMLDDLFHTLDKQWSDVMDASIECPDPDQFGLWDRIEYLAGIGLVACQRYLVCTYPQSRLTRTDAFSLPPTYSNGPTIVNLLNAGANYWKHVEERHWSAEPSLHKRTVDVITSAGLAVDADYLCSDMLDMITGKASKPFAAVSCMLVDWRTRLIASANNKLHVTAQPLVPRSGQNMS
jgi:hypothetical protein